MADTKVFTDGLGMEGETGAAAVLYRKGRRIADLKYHLGTLADHTCMRQRQLEYCWV